MVDSPSVQRKQQQSTLLDRSVVVDRSTELQSPKSSREIMRGLWLVGGSHDGGPWLPPRPSFLRFVPRVPLPIVSLNQITISIQFIHQARILIPVLLERWGVPFYSPRAKLWNMVPSRPALRLPISAADPRSPAGQRIGKHRIDFRAGLLDQCEPLLRVIGCPKSIHQWFVDRVVLGKQLRCRGVLSVAVGNRQRNEKARGHTKV